MYINIGIIYEKLDKPDIAIEYFNKSLQQNSNPESHVKAYSNLGRCYSNQESYAEAEKHYLIAIKESVESFGADHIQTADSYLDYGVFCDKIEEYSKAVHYLNKAYKIFLTNFGNQNRDVSNVLTALGDHHLDVNNYKKAINNYQEALISFVEEFKESDIYANPELHLIESDLNIVYT